MHIVKNNWTYIILRELAMVLHLSLVNSVNLEKLLGLFKPQLAHLSEANIITTLLGLNT